MERLWGFVVVLPSDGWQFMQYPGTYALLGRPSDTASSSTLVYQMGRGKANRFLLKVLRLFMCAIRPAVAGYRYAGVRAWIGSMIWPALLKEGTHMVT